MTITNMDPQDYLDEQETNEFIALRHLEQAAQLLEGEISHYTCVDSKLNKCQKYTITYDVNS